MKWLVVLFLCFRTLYAYGEDAPLKIALIAAPTTLGSYAQSIYTVSLATLLAHYEQGYVLTYFPLPDESSTSLVPLMQSLSDQGYQGIIAPLTHEGVSALIPLLTPSMLVYVPTLHHREFPDAPDQILFGGIDYRAQIPELTPYAGTKSIILNDGSRVGLALSTLNTTAKKLTFSTPTALSTRIQRTTTEWANTTLWLHLPLSTAATLASTLTRYSIPKTTLLSTQIGYSPLLLTLTQPKDRQRWFVANSIIELPSAISERVALLGEDIAFDWILYSASVGSDYLIATLTQSARLYHLPLHSGAVIYPIEILRVGAFGFTVVKK